MVESGCVCFTHHVCACSIYISSFFRARSTTYYKQIEQNSKHINQCKLTEIFNNTLILYINCWLYQHIHHRADERCKCYVYSQWVLWWFDSTICLRPRGRELNRICYSEIHYHMMGTLIKNTNHILIKFSPNLGPWATQCLKHKSVLNRKPKGFHFSIVTV